jgi:hypothetical protein
MAEQAIEPLLSELRNVVEQADPIPGHVVAAAKAAFSWRTIDAELAELAADSMLSGAGTRAADAARLLTFQAGAVEIEVEVADTGATRRLTGQLVPPSAAAVSVRWADGSLDAQADDLGRFTVEAVPAGTVRIAITRPDDSRTVVTSWVSI